MDRLQQAAAQQQGGDGEFTAAARTLLLQNLNLQDRFEKDVAPAMELLEAARQQLAEHTWAYGVFLPDFDEARRDELLKGRRVSVLWVVLVLVVLVVLRLSSCLSTTAAVHVLQ